jgi:hypothetical protein
MSLAFLLRQFLTSVLWHPIDYLLIDTPPGTSDEHISLVESLLKDVATTANPGKKPNLAGAVIVTTPQAVAISDVRKEINFCAKTGVRIIGVVENMSGYVCECCGVGTNLFSKGGGEVRAREFGVRFLGGVPIDGQWGVLVEEGRRPVYGHVIKRTRKGGMDKEELEEEEDDDDSDEDDGYESEEAAPREKDEGLLVDKYRSCSLAAVFEKMTSQVVEIVESDSGTRLKANAVA